MALIASTTIARHSVRVLEDGLSPMQGAMLDSDALITIVDAPTGSGKSFVFQKATKRGERTLFLVPTKRLGENQRRSAVDAFMTPTGANGAPGEAWSRVLAEAKIQCWNSDYSDLLRAGGVRDTRLHYANRLFAASPAAGGEIIFSTPELINHMFMRPSGDGLLADVHLGAVVSHFDRIVYDEFHLIEERGFGIVAALAAAAKQWAVADGGTRRARIYLLSATPVDVRPVLTRLGYDVEDPAEVRFISEEIVESGGRALHGDVEVEFHGGTDILGFLRNHPELAAPRPGEKSVVLYDSVRALRDDQAELVGMFEKAGCLPPHVDSGQHNQIESAHSGRGREIEGKDVVIGTSTLEVGITIPKVTLVLMNPGMTIMSLIQRIGRAARGDSNGRVIVVVDKLDGKPWLLEFVTAVQAMGSRVGIGDFMAAAMRVANLDRRFEVSSDDEATPSTFGKMGNRAVWSSALYSWIVHARLVQAKLGGPASRIKAGAPPQARAVGRLLATVTAIEGGSRWCKAFLGEAENLRSFAPTVKIFVEGQEAAVRYSEDWIKRHTHILDECPVELDGRGDAFVRCTRLQWDRLKDIESKGNPSRRSVVLPDGSMGSVGLNEVSDYLSLLDSARLERRRRTAFKAARELVAYTGVVPFADVDGSSDGEILDVGAASGIL